MANSSSRAGRPGISYQEVAKVASAIWAEGKRPTNATVRMQLGTGSPAKICEFMQMWWAEHNDEISQSRYTPSPALLSSIGAEVAQQVLSATADINDRQQAAEEDRDNLIREVGDLTYQLDEAHHRCSQLEEEIAQQNGILAEVRSNLRDASRREESLEQEREQLVVELAQSRSVLQHHEFLLTSNNELKEHLATAEQSLSSNLANLAVSTARCEYLQQSLAFAQSEIANLKSELGQAREATKVATERALIELSEARRQADRHLTEFVGSRSSFPPEKSPYEVDGQPAASLSNLIETKWETEPVETSRKRQSCVKDQILAVAEELLGSGPQTIEAIRGELVRRGISLGRAEKLSNLSPILSRSKQFLYDRSAGGWVLNANWRRECGQ